MVEFLTVDRLVRTLEGILGVLCGLDHTPPPPSNSGPASHELSLFPSIILRVNFPGFHLIQA